MAEKQRTAKREPETIKELLKGFRPTYIAAACGVGERTVYDWLDGAVPKLRYARDLANVTKTRLSLVLKIIERIDRVAAEKETA